MNTEITSTNGQSTQAMSICQQPYKDAAGFKAKDAKYQQARYINLNEDMKQKRLEQMRECDRKRREAKRKLKVETDLKPILNLDEQ